MKLILDLDTGIDDALAIAYGLGNKEAEIIGITTVFGNVDVKNANLNTLNILNLLNRNDIPVIEGAEHALLESSYTQKKGGLIFHGKNGLAETVFNNNNTKNLSKKIASDFLIESATLLEKDLTIVAAGPLTNIALAIEKAPSIMSKIKEIVIMGGALTVPGNVSPFAEANISQDVRAANILFKSGIPVTVIGLDVTLRTLLKREDIKNWATLSKAGEVYKKITDFYLDAHDLISSDLGGCALHDPLAVAVALKPDWIKGDKFNIRVIENGEQKGRLVSDLTALNSGEKKNIRVALDIDQLEFKEDFLEKIINILSSPL